uniref:Integrase catalytic domain-containing protein n=1 Tax=Vitis vinifera TaxID=29760 RepID=A5AXY4_VITVI|nr:hypothetical protein VITISV_007162 [Vitis vinifera]
MALGCMLAQLDDSGKKYIMIERLCLALVWATRRLRHYVAKYSILLVLRLDPLRYVFDRPVLTGRLMRWLVLLTEFDIQYVTQKSVKGSIVADHLASLPVSDSTPIDDDFPDEQFVSMTSIAGWRLYFDGAANQSRFGICILLTSFQGDHIPGSVQLAFSDQHRLTNNIIEYEACIIGLETALDLGTQGIWRTQDEKLKPYHAYLDLLIDRYCASTDRVMKEVHAGVCGPHMGGHMLARKIIRTVWGIDAIGKISPKSSSGYEYILVAVDYFTKWVEAASYVRLTAARVAKFIKSHIICRYGVPHELIFDRGVHFRAETNGAVEAINKNIKRILRKMVETSRDWSEKLPFALWAYRISFCTSTRATPYSLVYGMEAVMPVEIEMGSLRVALEQQISETEWAQSRYDQLSLLDERRLRAADHVQAY